MPKFPPCCPITSFEPLSTFNPAHNLNLSSELYALEVKIDFGFSGHP